MPRLDWLSEFLPARIRPGFKNKRRSVDARLSCCIEPLEERILLTSYVVNTLEDEATGVANGQLSLREAIIAAETNAAFGDAPAGAAEQDFISFAASLSGETITLTNNFFGLSDRVKISGPDGGITIDANNRGRIFRVNSSENIVLENLTLTNGRSGTVGAAILNSGTGELRISNVNFVENRTTGIGGAGIYSTASKLRIENSTFLRNVSAGTAGMGAGVFSKKGVVRISDTSFNNNIAGEAGGGLEIVKGSAILNNVNFTNNNSRFGGGLHVSDKAVVTYTGGTLSGNSVTRQGGAIWSQLGSKLIGTNLIFNSNSAAGDAATDGGGAFYNAGGAVRLTGGSISSNAASGISGSGGGLFSVSGNVVLDGVSITSNTANRAGGGLEVIEGVTTLKDATLSSNSAGSLGVGNPGNGGGLHVSGAKARVVLVGGTVASNTAANEGGGLWNQAGSQMIIRAGTLFSANTSAGLGDDVGGGAIFNNGGFVFIGSGSNFVSNTAAGGGGAIQSKNGRVELNGVQFQTNSASREGGAIGALGATLRIVSSQFGGIDETLANTSGNLSDEVGRGGAIYILGKASLAVIENSSFQSNTASTEGGAIWNGAGRLVVRSNSSFNTNAANGNRRHDGGGAIFNGGTLRVASSTFIANTAIGTLGSGGAIFSANGSGLITDSSFSGNIANRAGGAIEIGGGSYIFRDSFLGGLLGGNTAGPDPAGAPGNGGGIHITGSTSDVTLTNTQVVSNTAASEGGGLWNDAGSKLVILDSTISSNTASGDEADNGGGGVFNNGGTLRIDNSILLSNIADGVAGSGGGVLSTAGSFVSANTTYSANVANRAGGGIEVINGRAFLRNPTLGGIDSASGNVAGPISNEAPGNGGGLHVSGNSANVTIKGGTVQNNVAAKEGGGLWNQAGSKLEVVDGTVISQNTAQGASAGGGGIFNNGGNMRLANVQILENSATGTTGRGGGILSVAGNVVAANLIVRSNMANQSGAGIQFVTGTAEFFSTVVDKNTTGIRDAQPGDGAGVHIAGTGAQITFRDSQITENSAGGSGGGIWLAGGSSLIVRGTQMIRNTARATGVSEGGGAIYSAGGNVTIRNATINNNIASDGQGGGVFGGTNGTLSVASSEFRGNTSTLNGGGIYSAGSMAVNGTRFIANRSLNGGGFFTGPGGTTTGSGNLFVRNVPNPRN